jgi:hypothetical protein
MSSYTAALFVHPALLLAAVRLTCLQDVDACQIATPSQLPEHVVAQVLRHVDLQQRLAFCSLVCRAWRAAAAAATSGVAVNTNKDGSQLKLQRLEQWLITHGAAVTQLTVEHAYQLMDRLSTKAELRLPFASLSRLQGLQLHGCQLQELAGADVSSSMQRLHLRQREAPNAPASSSSSRCQQSLSSLTSLCSAV